MKLPISGNAKGYAVLLGVAVVGVVVLTLFFKKQVADAAKGVGGIISGDNALTEGTAYAGAGVAGTAGAAVNAASGGLFENIGSWLGNAVYDVTHPSDGKQATASVPLQTRKQATQDNFWSDISRVFTP